MNPCFMDSLIGHYFTLKIQPMNGKPIRMSPIIDLGKILALITWRYFEILNYHRGACDGQDNESLKNKVKFENWLGKEVMLDTY